MASNRAVWDQVRAIAYGSITATYQPLLTDSSNIGPFQYPMRLIHLINSTNGIMMVSFDGINDHVPVLAGTGVIYDITSDEDSNESLRMAQNTQVWVKYVTAPTSGGGPTFWCAAMYGYGE